MAFVSRILKGFWSLLVGLRITMGQLLSTVFRRRGAVTLRYPHEEPTLSPAYRSAIKLIRFEATNSHDCVACKACERICPSFCITIEGGKIEGIKKKRAARFEMDFSLCSLCGLCIDVCPTDTLEYSRSYDEAGYNRDWTHDLLAPYRDFEPQFVIDQQEREKKAAADKAKKKAAKKKAQQAKAAKQDRADAAKSDAPAQDEPAGGGS